MSSSGICWVSWCRLLPYLRSIAGLFAFYLQESQVFPVPSLRNGLWILCRKTCLTGFIQAIPLQQSVPQVWFWAQWLGSVWWQPPLNYMVSPVHLYMNTICTNTFTQKCQFRLRGAPQTLLPITPSGETSNPALHPLKQGLWHAHLCPSSREAWVWFVNDCAVRTSRIQSISVSHKWCRGCTFCRR